MPESLSVNKRHLVYGGYCAFGPLRQIIAIGGLAALFLPLLFQLMVRSLSTPVVTALRPERFFLYANDVHLLPFWLFVVVGIALALVAKVHRHLWSTRSGWIIPAEVIVGIPAFTAIASLMFRNAFDPLGAVSFTSLYWSLFMGKLAFGIWYGLFWLFVRTATKLLWTETVHSVIYQYMRYIGIPPERIFLIQVDEHDYSVSVRGSFSDLEVKRLRMGLLMALDHVLELEVYSSRAATTAVLSDLHEYHDLAKSRRDAALARLERQQATSGLRDSLNLPWQQRFFQHENAGPIVVCIGIICVLLMGFIFWSLGILRPISSEDIASFFGAAGSTQPRELLLTD